MVRWKCCLVLAMLLLLPRIDSKVGDDEDDDDTGLGEEGEDEEDEDEEDEDELEIPPKKHPPIAPPNVRVARTTRKAPLECYVCGYKSEIPLRSCLDPTKYRVRSVTCHNVDDKCFTSVTTKDKNYVEVIRGCRTWCVGSMGTSCCERNRCNNQAFAMPIFPRAQESHNSQHNSQHNEATKPVPPNVVFFVTVLLVLQTVVKVSFV